ncbi:MULTISPECIES: TlpA disulfide reductase family protein [Pandoraea]|uniref:Putative thiol:disulfide interchange protein n=1 Tax=Pandoraea communis TaxID=2508297 RepID=A0A5E4XLW7_9BURK|nr:MULTISPECIES: TlpA disulfide reductase family protein [Pandoraea]EON10743.1 putative thiol:disulfide interchange protein [Pandoraea sp. SD6-2]VVE37230.1 putative thiol:disulfide interchange protein [Pandoraea communis]
MTGLGPFSIQTVAVAAAMGVAWLVARYLLRSTDTTSRRTAASTLLDALFIGLLAARIAYVLRWWPEYFATPLSIIAIGDGGFNVWAGLPAALGWALWRMKRQPSGRRPMLYGFAAGVAIWAAAQAGLSVLQRTAPPLPSLTLSTTDGRTVSLDTYRGSPVVMNLWASWCPPCRREMPVLEKAQADYPDVRFLLINQGESAHTVEAFIQSQGLQFDDLLLDPASQGMQAAGARGLPTTLFFDAHGRLVDTHLGELTAARLRATLQGRLHQSPAPRTP